MKWETLDNRELTEDPFRCPWCCKVFDPLEYIHHMAPELLIAAAVSHLHARGESMDHIVQRLYDASKRTTQ